MIGHRVSDNYPIHLLKEGEYVCQKLDDQSFFHGMCPNGLLCNLSSHNVIEHSDRTITVSPSILCSNGTETWHGFLEKGIWKQV